MPKSYRCPTLTGKANILINLEILKKIFLTLLSITLATALDRTNLVMISCAKILIRNRPFSSRGEVLDLILDGDVPSRFQKHTSSLYQFFQNVYPTLYQFFKKYTRLYTNFPKMHTRPYTNCENCEDRYHSLYQNRENRYPSRWHVPVPKICIVHPGF